MLSRISMTLAGATALALPSVAAAEKVTRLAPATPWLVEWTDSSCTLARGFGEKDDPEVLRFEQFDMGQNLELLITAKALRGIRQGDTPLLIYGTGDGETGYIDRRHYALVGVSEKGVPTIFLNNTKLSGDEKVDAEAAGAEIIKVHLKFRGKIITFETGPLAKPFDAMRKCTEDLVRSWGLDPDQIKRLKSGPAPKTNPNNWFTSDDYPTVASELYKQALVSFRLLVDDTGKPTNCLIQRSHNDEIFNKMTCEKLMRRARFKPAQDEHGNPVNAYYTDNITWIVP